ncbi:MAG: type II secretion system protein GspE, partial [Gammaproteobacteria bacterium]
MNEFQLQGAEQPADQPAVAVPRRPPFLFAKRNGVLVTGYADDRALVMHTANVAPSALIELRRLVGVPLKLQRIDQEQFDALLSNSYEQGSSEAMQMMGDIGDDL